MKQQKILLVEDETAIASVEAAYLTKSGYNVVTAGDGKQALKLLESEQPDLIVLDLMLPELPGEAVLEAVRLSSTIPVIIVSAKSDEDDRISGLRHGADDYLTKPFSPRELVERVKAVLRRVSDAPSRIGDQKVITTSDGRIAIRFSEMRVLKDGSDMRLTKNEFLILSTLFAYPNKVFTRDEIIEVAFGIEYEAFDRAIDTHIKNIRQKIEDDPKKPIYIKTIYGVGYRAGGFE